MGVLEKYPDPGDVHVHYMVQATRQYCERNALACFRVPIREHMRAPGKKHLATRAYVSRMSEKVRYVVPRAVGQSCECLLTNIDLLLIRAPRSSEKHKALLSIQIAVLRSTLDEGLLMPSHTHSDQCDECPYCESIPSQEHKLFYETFYDTEPVPSASVRYVRRECIISLLGATHLWEVPWNGTWLAREPQCEASLNRLRQAGLMCVRAQELHRVMLEDKNDNGLLHLTSKLLLRKRNLTQGTRLFGLFVCDAILAPVLKHVLRSEWLERRKGERETDHILQLGWAQEFYNWQSLPQKRSGLPVFSPLRECPEVHKSKCCDVTRPILDKMRSCGYTTWSAVQAVCCHEAKLLDTRKSKCILSGRLAGAERSCDSSAGCSTTYTGPSELTQQTEYARGHGVSSDTVHLQSRTRTLQKCSTRKGRAFAQRHGVKYAKLGVGPDNRTTSYQRSHDVPPALRPWREASSRELGIRDLTCEVPSLILCTHLSCWPAVGDTYPGSYWNTSCLDHTRFFRDPVDFLVEQNIISKSEGRLAFESLRELTSLCSEFAACGVRVSTTEVSDGIGSHVTVTKAGLLYFAAWYVLKYMSSLHTPQRTGSIYTAQTMTRLRRIVVQPPRRHAGKLWSRTPNDRAIAGLTQGLWRAFEQRHHGTYHLNVHAGAFAETKSRYGADLGIQRRLVHTRIPEQSPARDCRARILLPREPDQGAIG
ncbi:hypothetical protein CRENBAI_017650 [Crenichthys baileyi]|uniref:Uncharacterized protein n=1 Tax=Crenichthys baileyi TaxID=28760 RepID=A0AAV9RQU0_9TELE